VFSSDTIPSTAAEEYDIDTLGVAPNPVGGIGTEYDQLNDPICGPTDHDDADDNGVAVNEPELELKPLARPYTEPPEPDAKEARSVATLGTSASLPSSAGTDDEGGRGLEVPVGTGLVAGGTDVGGTAAGDVDVGDGVALD
jgi:hypothetical protein